MSRISKAYPEFASPDPIYMLMATNLILPKLEGKWVSIDGSGKKQLQGEVFMLQKYLDVAQDIFIVINADCIVSLINKKGCEILGYSEEEVIGKNWFDRFLPENIKTDVKAVFDKIMSGDPGSVEYYENRVLTKNGEERDIAWHNAILMDDSGNISGVLSSGMDITVNRQIEKALRESKEEYRALIDNTNEIITVAQDGVLKFVNTRAAKLTGYSETELISRTFIDFVHPDDREMVIERYQKRLKGEKAPAIYAFRCLDRSGKTIWVETSAAPITWHGRPAILSFITNITTRKQLKIELRESNEKLKQILESSPDAITVTDLEGNITECNQMTLRTHGFSIKAELIGTKALNLIAPKDRQRALENLEKTLKENFVRNVEYTFLAKDGHEFPAELSASVIRDSSGSPKAFVAITKNITERKRMEEELMKMQKLESMGILAGGIAHDFNNLLTVIMGNISLARVHTDPGKVSERLIEAEKASMRATDLAQQLLTFSRDGAPIKELATIEEILRDSTAFALHGSNIRCEFSIPDDLWQAEVDVGQISQVISNLVINAKQAMPEGGVINLRAENINIGTEFGILLQPGAFIKVSVEDQGIGIPPEHLHRIFDPFFTTKQTGSGLGLATSFSIIRKHNGYITAESQVGIGTTFCIYLPAFPESVISKTQNRRTSL